MNPQGDFTFEGPQNYITAISLTCEAANIEQAQDQVNSVIEWAEGHGFKLVDGLTSLVREKDPIEQVAYASTEPLRNKMAERMLGQSERITGSPSHN